MIPIRALDISETTLGIMSLMTNLTCQEENQASPPEEHQRFIPAFLKNNTLVTVSSLIGSNLPQSPFLRPTQRRNYLAALETGY